MSYLGTMTTEQLAHNGFYVSPDNPRLAINKIYPHLSVRHHCQTCGNWSRGFNGKCPQCHKGSKPLQPTKQHFKFYYQCCRDEDCPVRKDAFRYLQSCGLDTKWTCHDGSGGGYVDLAPIREWDEEKRNDFYEEINCFSVSFNKARKLKHPDSKAKSKLPNKR